MNFDWLAFHNFPTLNTNTSLAAYVVAVVYAVVVLVVFLRHVSVFATFTPVRWILFVACILLSPVFVNTLIVEIVGVWLPVTRVPLLGFLPLFLAAMWLGRSPAALVGLITGLSWALFDSERLTQPFEVAVFAGTLSLLLNNNFRGKLPELVRQPLFAALVTAVLGLWPLSMLGIMSSGNLSIIGNLERTLSFLLPALIISATSALIAGLILQVVVLRVPKWRPLHDQELVPPPWQEHLTQRLLYSFIPGSVIAIIVLVGIVGMTAYRVATGLLIEQMAHDADNVGSQVPFVFQSGLRAIRGAAQNSALAQAASGIERQAELQQEIEGLPYFQQLIFLGASASTQDIYPIESPLPFGLTSTELALAQSVLQGPGPEYTVMLGEVNDAKSVIISVADRVIDPDTGEAVGVLIGRTTLDANATFGPALKILQHENNGVSQGILLDADDKILVYPAEPGLLGQTFSLENLIDLPEGYEGTAFRQRQPDQTRQIVYSESTSGSSGWQVLIAVPNEVVLQLALQIALPTLLVTVVMALGVLPLSLALLHRITEPIEQLANAADLMTEGQLSEPFTIEEESEIGKLSHALDKMRVRLALRLNEQERLLSISRSVSSSLELFRAMPPILNSALDITRASGVRVVLGRGDSQAPQVYASGEFASMMAVLDNQLMDLVEQQGTAVISQLWRASGSLDTTNLDPKIRALVALPLRSDTSFHGVLWVAYNQERMFEESDLTFLSTLAGQAAVATSNARLFTEADQGKRKLEAVLSSTADGMIVVDKDSNIILVNPAAEKYLEIRAEQAASKKASQVIDNPELANLMTNLQEPISSLEIPYRNGKTLLANTSPIMGHDGGISGRVAVLRDITALKELDNIKTVFLRMVSHDLRSPLTYMRGYTQLIHLSGVLNERQVEAVERINNGIDHITQMTERLTYLSRLQFGEDVELEMALIDVKDMLEQETQRHQELAKQKEITIKVVVEENLPLLLADQLLFSHAISNLIQNALKYTQENGKILVKAAVDGSEPRQISVAVIDNGPGIREEDQAHLFEAFYRVPQRPGDPTRPKGSGLGLALVRSIANAHNGAASVESEFGKGSMFKITFPVRNSSEL